MGSNEQLGLIEEPNLKSEALKQAEESSSTKECDSLVPLVSMSSAEPATGCVEQPLQINTTVQVSEVLKEDPKSPSFEECSSFVMEIPALESALDPLGGNEETVDGSDIEQQFCLVVNNSGGSEGTPVDGCVATDQDVVIATSCGAETESKAAVIDGFGDLESDPEFDKLSEVECDTICLHELNHRDEVTVSDLKTVASSVEDLRFSGVDCLSNTLGESQVASREDSFSSAATGVEEDGLYFDCSNINASVEGNMKSAMDLNDAVKPLHIHAHKSTSSLLNSSTEWCKETVSGHLDAPLVEINPENSEKDRHVLGDKCFPRQDRGLSVGHAFPLERSTLLPEQLVENLSNPVKQGDSLHFSDPALVVSSGTPSGLVRQEAFKLNGILEGNNSAMADISHFTCERRGNVHIVDPEALESNEALSFLRRSSRDKKIFQEGSNKKYTRKGSKKALGRTMDLLSAAVRSKRSCSNRSARVSGWGLIESLSKYIKLNTRVVDPGSGKVKSGGKSRKKGKVHVDTSSNGLNSKARNHASSGQVSLKLKLVRKGKSVIQSTPLTGIKVNPLNGSGDNQQHLSNCIKDVTEDILIKSQEYISDLKLEKSTVLENSGVAADTVDRDLEVTLVPGKCSSIGASNLSDKDVQKSGGSADDRHLNSGTSPDSEVIHIPNPQFLSKDLEVHHNDGVDSFNSARTPAENGHPAMAKMRRKKGKKEQICQPGDSDEQNRLLSSLAIDKTQIPENYCKNGSKSNMTARLGVHHESADSCNCTKVLSSAEAKGSRKPKGLKLKEKTKVKSKPANAPRLKMDDSRKGKVDKWKLIGKYSINENGISDLVRRKEDDPEAAGNHGIDDYGNKNNITRKDVVYEGVTNLPVIPGGAGQQRAQLRTAWVCCDDCLKWRCIPANLADTIDETNCRWTCKDNQDKAFADCSVSQEKSNREINAELNISDDEDGFNIHKSGKYYSMKHSAVPQQSSWMLIKSNIFLHRSRYTQTLDEIMVCHCKSSREGKLGCGDECLNRMLNIECVHGTCPCGDLCSNQQFQRQSYANLKWFRSGKKGYGLQVQEDISEGKFLIEYVGEVLDLTAYEERQREYASKGHKHFYFMTLNGNEVIDACAKGNLGRFINHSCDPNCRTEKWMVNGEICIGLFAVRDIKKGEELTFDYNYVRVFGAAAKKCYCGSPQCRGYIGGDRLNNEVVVQSDSDEEFPEPVVVYENGEFANDLNMMSESNSLDVMEEKKDETLLQSDADILLDRKDLANSLEESLTTVGGQLRSIAEKNSIHSSVFELENVDNSTLKVQQESPINRISVPMASPKRSDSLSLNISHPESLSESADARFTKSATEIIGGKVVQSKGRPRMKICRPSKSGKSKESDGYRSGAVVDYSLVTPKKSQPTPTKLKKLVESSVKHHFETVEEKLNELLDDAGGICKRKDAFKGYLKLLVLTAASGDCNHHETIQSNKDLSMILDAILKTKSRTVLTDILNKNGLQMLHSMMKKCRGNFNMIPILRKLLKVFEFLVERKILNLEHINGDPPRPGVESFRDSILKLTEHEDRKVHQIARNFRDKWIPRPVKKFNCVDKGDWSTDVKRTPDGSKFVKSTYSTKQQSLPPGHLVDSEGSSHFGECTTNRRGNGKRKSRWDQSPGSVSPRVNKEQKTADDLHTFSETHHLKKDEEMQEIEEDAPPGFSCPSFGGPHQSNNRSTSPVIPISQQYPGPLKCPSQIPLGFAQEGFNSSLPVAYGIPFNLVQEFGTPQALTADGWVIAPGMPFRPFPPLPLCPHKGQKRETPSGFTHTVSNVNTRVQYDRGGPCNLGRRPSKRRNDFRKPPWGFHRNGFGSGRNFAQRRPSGVVVMGTVVNDRNEHPENVNNYGVEFAGNSC